MKGSWIAVGSHDGRRFEAYLSRPEQGSGPGLVLCHGIFGIDDETRKAADLYAAEGYVVIVPDLFWRLRPRVQLGQSVDEVRLGRELLAAFDDAAGLVDIGSAIGVLRRDPACRGKVGTIGCGLGGKLALLAAAAGEVDCAVSYDGVGLEPVLDRVAASDMPVLLHMAGAGSVVSAAEVQAVRKRLEGRPSFEVCVYPDAGHGFAIPGRPAYDKQAADMAHTRTVALLRRVMGPHYDLSALWEAHRACEFDSRDADATIRTMVDEPYVNHIPTMTGGYGRTMLHRFYKHHFIPKNPKDVRSIPISRTIGVDRVVNEVLMCFTHDSEIDWMLPGVPPTGKYVEVALVGIITFRGDKLMHEHIYWDQASVLVQIGLLDPTGLPVAGIESARKVMDPSRPSNTLMPNWKDSAPA